MQKEEDSYWQQTEKEVIRSLGSSENGLEEGDVPERIKLHGRNELEKKKIRTITIFLNQFKSPLITILLVASTVAFFFGEIVNAIIIWSMILLSALLSFYNEYRSEKIVADLTKKIAFRTIVLRNGEKQEIDARDITIGDIVILSHGDIVPADLRIIEEKNLEIDEAIFTGESIPARKESAALNLKNPNLSDLKNYAFSGTIVSNGSGKGIVISTGCKTEFGKISKSLEKPHPETEFQKGIRKFGNLLVKTTVILTVLIFAINGFFKHDWLSSLLFALAVAIGLTPELLPAIVSVNLSKGAYNMSKKDVIVKRLIAIEDFGNMDVLCTDKTGTLTEGKMNLTNFYNINKYVDEEILLCSLICNSAVAHERVSSNPIDLAIIERAKHSHSEKYYEAKKYEKIHEIPFDYNRRMMSVIARKDSKNIFISKGAPESILSICEKIKIGKKTENIKKYKKKILNEFHELSAEGSRVIAIAYKNIKDKNAYSAKDENDLIFMGFLVFFDPPKSTAKASLAKLKSLNVDLKILTGDNEFVSRKVCEEIGIDCKKIVLGKDLNKISDEKLKKIVGETTVFARITPEQKLRVIKALRANGHVVGCLGDGVNDAPSLYEADVGISVDGAVDVAKDSADIVLLHKSLRVLADGIIEGRKIFSNTMKYVLMGTSSNFGNMFSVAVASIFLPFLPMLPIQILLTNLIYDVSQLTIPSDNVDASALKKPKKWDINFIKKYMLFFGPISSLYDFITFAVLIFVFHAGASLFQTGWFIESLATEILVIFVIRTNMVPFFKSKPSKLLTFGCLGCVALGVLIPFTFFGQLFGFIAPPLLYFVFLIMMVITYLVLVEFAKDYFFRKHGF